MYPVFSGFTAKLEDMDNARTFHIDSRITVKYHNIRKLTYKEDSKVIDHLAVRDSKYIFSMGLWDKHMLSEHTSRLSYPQTSEF